MTTRHTSPTVVDDREPDHEVELDVEVSEDGPFAPGVAEYARQKVRAAARHCHGPILRASIRLVRHANPALPRPVVSRATLNVNGRLVRAHTAAASAREGLDALQHVLRTALDRLDRQQDGHSRHPHPTPAEPAAEEREIGLLGAEAGACSVDEAIGALDALDRDFQLFQDVDTEVDTMVFRAGPTGYRLARTRHCPLEKLPETAVSVEINAAPRLSVDAAVEQLAGSGQPFLFFADSVTGRGTVLHVRQDEHYGLVTVA
jgi:hypothetical protein